MVVAWSCCPGAAGERDGQSAAAPPPGDIFFCGARKKAGGGVVVAGGLLLMRGLVAELFLSVLWKQGRRGGGW